MQAGAPGLRLREITMRFVRDFFEIFGDLEMLEAVVPDTSFLKHTAWKPPEAVRDPRGPIWPSATSIQGFLPELGRFQAGVVRERRRVLDGVRWRK